MKFDVVVGNPPYQKVASGINDKSNKQGMWFSILETALNIGNNNTLYGIISPKSIFGTAGFYNSSSKINKILKYGNFNHVWPDLTEYFPEVGIEICGYIIDRSKSNLQVTVNGYNKTTTINNNYPAPFYFSPDAVEIIKRIWPLKPTIEFKENIKPKDNDVVFRVNGGRFKKWDKIYVGYNKDTKHNQQGAIIKKQDFPGYKSGSSSILWEYIFKVFGGEKGNSVTGICKNLPIMNDMTKSYTNEEWFNNFGINTELQKSIEIFLKEH